jgi:hypothetical protein
MASNSAFSDEGEIAFLDHSSGAQTISNKLKDVQSSQSIELTE